MEDRLLLSTTWVVTLTSDTDAGQGVMGDVLYCVNHAASGDTIQFNLGANSVVYLNSPLAINNKDLTIDGANKVALDGNSANQIFNISGSSDVTINDLILQNGKGNTGGAINDNAAGALTLARDQFITNTSSASGGAIYASISGSTAGPLTVSNCSFTGNIAGSNGGAIYADTGSTSGVNLTKSEFINNRTSSGNGGAVAATGDPATTLQVTDCTFQNNGVSTNGNGNGGAIYTTDTTPKGQATITGSTFTSNFSSNGYGGAVAYQPEANSASSLLVTYNTFASNTAVDGGAVQIQVNTNSGAVTETLYGNLFNGNKATTATNSEGGGIYVGQTTSGTGSATLDLNNSTFYQNTSSGEGGGIALYLNGADTSTNLMKLTSLTVYQNQAAATNGGGGLWVDPNSVPPQNGTAPQVTNNIIAGNTINNKAASGADIEGSIFTASYNLVGIGDGATVTNNGGKWLGNDIVGTVAAPHAPGLDPNGLQNNGGPTQTIKLLPTSDGYQNGNSALGGSLDQRGYTRPNQKISRGAYDPNATAP